MTLRTFSIAGATAAALLFATPGLTAQETAKFAPEAKVTRFTDDNCMIDSGKVPLATVNNQPITAEKKGCLTIKGTDGKSYFVSRPKKKIECKEMAANTVSTVTAGSAGANEKCNRQ
ncbi:MAG: hypothetical protein EON95_04895 [Caulobacteraceae bacterium]|nr:MAG: hypothetical protein EON95_04895 [Caulobacteraceae bacterium]